MLICGDNVNELKKLPDNHIDLTVTSPPYDNLRDYKGYSFDFEGIAKQLFRVTKDGGVVVWVVGDSTKEFCESLTSFRQVLFFKDIGFNVLDTMIYGKNNYKPTGITPRRYSNQFEFMFVFSKGKPKTFNPIRVKKVKRNRDEETASRRQKDGTLKHELVIHKDKLFKYATNVWFYAVGGNLIKHPAVFPEQLAKDHIISWSNEGDLVLDPFVGSGTTCKMAKQLGRKYIGIDISQEYIDIAKKRVEIQQVL